MFCLVNECMFRLRLQKCRSKSIGSCINQSRLRARISVSFKGRKAAGRKEQRAQRKGERAYRFARWEGHAWCCMLTCRRKFSSIFWRSCWFSVLFFDHFTCHVQPGKTDRRFSSKHHMDAHIVRTPPQLLFLFATYSCFWLQWVGGAMRIKHVLLFSHINWNSEFLDKKVIAVVCCSYSMFRFLCFCFRRLPSQMCCCPPFWQPPPLLSLFCLPVLFVSILFFLFCSHHVRNAITTVCSFSFFKSVLSIICSLLFYCPSFFAILFHS